jgi:competence protein ComEA
LFNLQPFRDYLDLHQRERRGLIALIILIALAFLVMSLVPYVYESSFPNQKELERRMADLVQRSDSLALQKEAEFHQKKASNSKYKKTKNSSSSKANKDQPLVRYFEFNPNTSNEDEWKKLGLNKGQIKTIKNYLAKGGEFYKPEDLAKIYSIPKEQYESLRPYIQIPKVKSEHSFKKDDWFETEKFSKEETDENLNLDLNTADTVSLKKLKGIGSYFSKKIVEYRDELGGFHSKEQLLEIWNFDEEKLEGIKGNIFLTEAGLSPIRINRCAAEELQKHPYIKWNQAKALIAYRVQHGAFNEVEDIKKCHLISEELCQKIKPYLEID